jgi:hypothetical protein
MKSAATITIRFEQAVYGSFPFWDRGYAVLAQSPGCRPEWLAEFRAACQRYGERPAGAAEAGGLFATRLSSGSWMIVGPSSQGVDDRGRPGAVAFHALFLRPREYRRAGYVPFGLAGALRNDWTADTQALAPGEWEVELPGPPAPPPDDRAARIVATLVGGRRVAIEAQGPIDELAKQVWLALPERVRKRASVATWAFGNGSRFDLVALPRLAGVELDESYADPEAGEAPRNALYADERGPEHPRPHRGPLPGGGGAGCAAKPASGLSRRLPYLGLAAVLAGTLFGLAWRHGQGKAGSSPTLAVPTVDQGPPDPASYGGRLPDHAERRRVTESLVDLADRFGVSKPGEAVGEPDPTVLMTRIADRLRYRGRLLSPGELARLGRERGKDRDLALAWHARVRRFAGDRPLPAGFARGPLRWQLDTLSWSFHLDGGSRAARRRRAAEVPHALAEFLTVDVPTRPVSLSPRYPALADYARFLAGLPRR